MRATAFWTVAEGRGELRDEALRAPGPGEVLVRTRASGVSRGTERLVFGGRVPEGERARMRAPMQAGDFPFPVKYGYAAVGVVEDGDAAWVGRRVFCLHPHQDRFVAPVGLCAAVPEAVPDARAVLAANTETAVNVLWDAAPLVGERALVIGAGVVGLLAARLLSRLPGVEVVVADPDPSRAAACAALGLQLVTPEEAPGERDLIVHASGNPAGLRTALRCAGFEARIVEASWFGAAEASLALGEAFHAGRVTIRSSQVGHVSPAMRGRRTHADRMTLALALLDDPLLDVLLGPEVAFGDLPQAMPRLLGAPREGGAAALCPIVKY